MFEKRPQNLEKQHKVVILCGPHLHHLSTCATIISQGVNVVGVCIADQRNNAGLPISYLSRSLEKKGLFLTLSQVLARLLYSLFNKSRDKEIFEKLFDEEQISNVIEAWNGLIYHTDKYDNPDTLTWLTDLQPDVLVIHTPYWVGKKVRNLPSTGIVLGGHPGITPFYRGTHSAFWAIYHDKPEDVGYTVFLVDKSVDGGDIVAQDTISIEPGDSYVTLGWKGMRYIAKTQAEILRAFDQGVAIPRQPVSIPDNSYFDHPGLWQYLQYRKNRHNVR